MSTPGKRSYSSQSRAQSAEETRARILDAALALFGGGGPNGLLIAAAITFGVGVTHRLFPGRRRRRWSEAR